MRRIQESFERSPRKLTRRASRELGIPQPSGVCSGAVYCSNESIFLNHPVQCPLLHCYIHKGMPQFHIVQDVSSY
jgi:hypothetical protein